MEKVKAMGYEVVNSNLYEDSPAFAFADYCEVADVLDKEKNLEIARKYHVQAVLTDESDIAVPTVAYVAGKLGLPTIGEDLARLFTNKYEMRCFCREHGLKTPEFRLCENADEAAAFVREFAESDNSGKSGEPKNPGGTGESGKSGKRCIMKPLDSQSSRGVYVLEKPEDAYTFFASSASYSSARHAVIVEQYIEGVEFTVDGIAYAGEHRSLAISEKKHFSYNTSIASELFFSETNDRYDYAALKEQNDRLVALTGLPFGLTHAEYKWEDGEFYLIEIAARGGGTRISSHIVPLLTGIDNYRFLIEAALGHPIEAASGYPSDADVLRSADSANQGCLPSEDSGFLRAADPAGRHTGRCAVLEFLSTDQGDGQEEGVVAAIRGAREVRANPSVLELRLEFSVGDRLKRADDDRSRVGFYIAYGESEEELRRTMRWVKDTLKIEYTDAQGHGSIETKKHGNSKQKEEVQWKLRHRTGLPLPAAADSLKSR
ncbi:MAG: ATP-grasp domain-containing protein [Lachnospiraceae bacterium]|nr:ATP-grasp domain-containing protein [Lachnospiraceae bacterium]